MHALTHTNTQRRTCYIRGRIRQRSARGVCEKHCCCIWRVAVGGGDHWCPYPQLYSSSIAARSSLFQLAYAMHLASPQSLCAFPALQTLALTLESPISLHPPIVSLLARVSARVYGFSYLHVYAGVQSATLRRAEGIKVDVAIQAKDDAAASSLSGGCHVNKRARVP